MDQTISATDNQVTAGADNQNTGPAANSNWTGANGGQANGQAAPTDELFKGINPNQLPPEIKAHYDGMLRDYREKTARLSEMTKSEVAKATEAYKSKAEYYDQILGQEEFVKQWNDYVQKANGTAAEPTNAGDPKLTQLEATVREMHEKLQAAELQKVTDAFAEAVNEKGEKLNADFDRLNNLHLGQLVEGDSKEDFSLLRACIELSPGKTPQEKLAAGYQSAKKFYDSIFEEGRKAGLGRNQSKVMNGSLPPTNLNGNLSTTDKRPKNAGEAIEMARKGIVVSR